ncbi:zinc metalloprotease HtpX [Devriesea agamarum]|uniref:zinc metalloprotease HtpX n=1 Tax=Devriesea agamarum TaxID=472569 RepID=UPI00071E61D2|nr:zinc metalloprotease HtpX [Devriesea agamarum]
MNTVRTAALFGVLWGVLLAVGWFVGNGRWIWLFALVGLIGTAISFWNSDKIALRSMRAYPVSPEQAPRMYAIVSELSAKANAPMPRLYVSPTQAPNAFATGRSPRHAAVCCTEGILSLLDDRELRGVLGHELMHVYNRDILTSSVAAAIGGIITSIAQMLMFFGGGGNDRERNGGGFGMLGALAAMILAPLAATLIQLAISRTREYSADSDGATLTEDPLALASALRKLQSGTAQAPLKPEPDLMNSSHLMIANPFKAGEGLAGMFATHPPMEQRIARLERMAEDRYRN